MDRVPEPDPEQTLRTVLTFLSGVMLGFALALLIVLCGGCAVAVNPPPDAAAPPNPLRCQLPQDVGNTVWWTGYYQPTTWPLGTRYVCKKHDDGYWFEATRE